MKEGVVAAEAGAALETSSLSKTQLFSEKKRALISPFALLGSSHAENDVLLIFYGCHRTLVSKHRLSRNTASAY